MKNLVILFILIAIPGAVTAAVTTRVCEADDTTLFDNRDIMVGTRLTIIVYSDNIAPWAGDVAILGDLQNYGVLTARGFNEATNDWKGSRFPAAGTNARVYEWTEEGILGLHFANGSGAIANKDWFIVDYTATAVGDCNVAFYDFSIPPSYFLPSTGAFHQVPTRDFYQPAVPDPNVDPIVNFADFTILAGWWQQNCESPGGCDGADLDDSNDVDIEDLMLFCDYWLEETE